MKDPRFPRLVAALLKQSSEGKIEWQSTAADGVYQSSFPKYSVQLMMRDNPGNSAFQDVIVNIRNADGAIIEQFSDSDLPASAFSDPFGTMTELYGMARRKALGADKALDDLLIELGDNDDLL